MSYLPLEEIVYLHGLPPLDPIDHFLAHITAILDARSACDKHDMAGAERYTTEMTIIVALFGAKLAELFVLGFPCHLFNFRHNVKHYFFSPLSVLS
jgi:hypothetical protein